MAVDDLDPETIVKPVHIHIQPTHGWTLPNLGDFWRYRDLLYEMAIRDIKARYKQTILGVVWVILQPMMNALVFSLVFGLIAKLPSDGTPYVLFAYINLMGWGYFSSSITRGANSLVSQAGLISKVYFPRILIPFSNIIGSLVDLTIVFVLVLVMVVLFGRPLTWRILVIPVFVLLLTLSAAGVGFWLSSLSVYYRDFRNLTPTLIQVWMYLTPIAYSDSVVPDALRAIYNLNPVVAPVTGIRWALLGTSSVSVAMLLYSLIISFLLFITGAFVLRRLERTIVDIV